MLPPGLHSGSIAILVVLLIAMGDVTAAPRHVVSPAVHAVKLSDFKFTPARLTIKAGTRVVWKNASQSAHTVTSTATPPLFDSQNLNPGDVFTVTFTTPGVYHYVCTYHASIGMKGVIIVH